MSFKTRALSFFIAAFLLLSGCGLNKPPKSTLRYDISGSPATLDPQYADRQSELAIINNSFEGLTAISADGKVSPAAAESWEVSADKKSYTFTLRNDIKWSNGDAVTADELFAGFHHFVTHYAGFYCHGNFRRAGGFCAVADRAGKDGHGIYQCVSNFLKTAAI